MKKYLTAEDALNIQLIKLKEKKKNGRTDKRTEHNMDR
jgi:hypothetical protein